ncbi:MAG: DNA-binding protein [Ruminococcaceae bacterium]|nr:DNA-binding protein [Oscillospiraceae bacterium]MBQ8897449.1 YlxM family DNA-binding protein [Clostridia bacterium]
MKENAFRMCMLFDFYGPVLTERQQEVFDLYYNEDLSLTEISEHANITRQGVRDAVVKASNILNEMEEKLGLVEKFIKTTRDFDRIAQDVDALLELNRKRYRSTEFDLKLTEILALARQNT